MSSGWSNSKVESLPPHHRAAIGAYSKLDAIFSGGKVGGFKMSDLEVEIVTESLRWIEGGEDAVDHKKLDLFILETMSSDPIWRALSAG